MNNLPGTLIPEVPKELFVRKTSDDVFAQKRHSNKLIKIIDVYRDEKGQPILDEKGKPIPKVEYPESGGVFTWHETFPYPEKGMRDDFMIMSIQFTKRMLINWLKFLSYKPLVLSYIFALPWGIKILEKFLKEFIDYAEMVDNHGARFILEKRYYSTLGRELMKGIYLFLKGIGISEQIADKTAHIFIALVDNDTAYYYRLVDILNEADKEMMLKNPHKELMFLMKTFAEREGRPHLVAKFNIFGKALVFALWIPRVKKSFKSAVEAMDFNNLKMDEADHYHVRNKSGYNYLGMTFEERLKKWPLEPHDYIELKWNE